MLNPLQPMSPQSASAARATAARMDPGPQDRVEIGGARREPGVRDAMRAALQADLRAGTARAESEAALARLDEALHARISPWEWQVVPVYRAYEQHFAGRPEAREGLELLIALARRGIYGEDAETAAGALAQPLDGVPLGRRTELFGQLLEAAGDPAPALLGWTLMRPELEAGRDGEAAVERVRQLTQAFREAGLEQEHQQKPVLDACREHLSQAPALVPGWPVHLLDEGVGGEDLVLAIAEAGKVLGPLLQAAPPQVADSVGAALRAPSKGSWKADLEALREVLSMVAGPTEFSGRIGEEPDWVVIGEVSLPKREAGA